MNRMGAKAAAVLIAGLLVGATACGGGTKKEESSGTGDAVSATVQPTTTTERSTATTASSGANDLSGAMGQLGSAGDCLQAASAYAQVGLSMLQYLGGASSDQISQLESQINDLKPQIPSEIQGDFATFSAAVQAYASAMQGVDMSNILDSGVQSKLEEAGAKLETPEVKQAQSNIDEYFNTHCS
jgi:hypothetical protein